MPPISQFSPERDHSPVEHRELEYVIATATFVEPPWSDIVLAQAQAFVESYLRLTQR